MAGLRVDIISAFLISHTGVTGSIHRQVHLEKKKSPSVDPYVWMAIADPLRKQQQPNVWNVENIMNSQQKLGLTARSWRGFVTKKQELPMSLQMHVSVSRSSFGTSVGFNNKSFCAIQLASFINTCQAKTNYICSLSKIIYLCCLQNLGYFFFHW